MSTISRAGYGRMKGRRPLHPRRISSGVLMLAFASGAWAPVPSAGSPPVRYTDSPPVVEGRLRYRTGPEKAARPDAGARVWLLTGPGREVASAVAMLRAFERRYPEGLTRDSDRPAEEAARKSAIRLMTYASVHRDRVVGTAVAHPDGSYALPIPAPGTYVALAESAATMGSYHFKRYAVKTFSVKTPSGRERSPVPFSADFGVSHLEDHE